MRTKDRFWTLNLLDANDARPAAPASPTRRRLEQAFTRLQAIAAVRRDYPDPLFGKVVEERIVWRELLELELQSIDEQIERTSYHASRCSAAKAQ